MAPTVASGGAACQRPDHAGDSPISRAATIDIAPRDRGAPRLNIPRHSLPTRFLDATRARQLPVSNSVFAGSRHLICNWRVKAVPISPDSLAWVKGVDKLCGHR